jgi:ribosome maturation factor RimP
MALDIKAIEQKAEQVTRPVLANLGYELIASEFLMESGRWTLRLFIDKVRGVTIDDCERASHAVEDLLEVEEVVPVEYSLEVSSPGLLRPLARRQDFEKHVGDRIKVKTAHPIDGRSHFKGILAALEGEDLVMIIDNARYCVPLSAVGRARLDPELFPERKKVN